jgi:hypothetical protein
MRELLLNTAGLARLGRNYAESVLSKAVDGGETSLAVASDLRISCWAIATRTGAEIDNVTLSRDGDDLEMNRAEARRVFAVLHGIVSTEYDEPLEAPTLPPTPDFLAALDLLRRAQGLIDAAPGEMTDAFASDTDAFLGRFPKGAA